MLEISDITIKFGGLTALSNVSFRVEAGRIVSVIGPNGAGKTTLFNIISGFIKPSDGKVAYKDIDITGKAPNRIARAGLVRTFQKTEVFPELSVVECVKTGFLCHNYFSISSILFGRRKVQEFERECARKTTEILEFIGLSAKADNVAGNLSYGEQRLLEIAVGLAASPELILLDEPASGMNADEAERIMDFIGRLRHTGTTVLLVEHNMQVVMGISDEVIVLNHGQMIARGTPDELSDNPGVISAYLGEGWKDAGT